MTTQEKIDKHQVCIEILEAIRLYMRLISNVYEGLNGFPGTFPRLRKKCEHDIDIYNRCIRRLESRHEKVLGELNNN